MATGRKKNFYTIHNFATRVSFSTLASVHDCHSIHDVRVRVYCQQNEASARAKAANQKTKELVTKYQGEFQCQKYMFVSMHSSDHNIMVRIFVGPLNIV